MEKQSASAAASRVDFVGRGGAENEAALERELPASWSYAYANYRPDFDVEGLIEALRETAEAFFADSGSYVQVNVDHGDLYDGVDGLEIVVDDCDVLQLKAVPRPRQNRDGSYTAPEPHITIYPRVKDKRELIVLDAVKERGPLTISQIAELIAGRPHKERSFLDEVEREIIQPLLGKGFLGERGFNPVNGKARKYDLTELGRQALESAPYFG